MTSPMTSLPSIGLQAVAVSVPDRVVTNDHWRQNHPALLAKAEERLWMWKSADMAEGSEAFNRAMAPYVRDPFRGAVQRRLLTPDDPRTSLPFEVEAASQALEAAGLAAEDVDLLICTSFAPDVRRSDQSVGGAAFVARELGLTGAAWNLETACSSMLLAFQTACSLVQAGQYQRALVVTSTFYSRSTVESEPIGWGVGDAAVALVVGHVAAGTGHLGSHSINSSATCGTIITDVEIDGDGHPYFHMKATKTASTVLRDVSEPYLKECTAAALARAGVGLADVDFFVFNTPLAWYADFCARALGVDASRTISVYPLYANVGAVLPGINLHHAAFWGKIRKGDLVLIYTVGSVSSCCAAVLRWGDVALGPLPDGASLETLELLAAEGRDSSRAANAA